MGIEPTSEAWEASILPLYDARSISLLADYTQTPPKTFSQFPSEADRPLPSYSCLSAAVGSIRLALRAGIQQANAATVNKMVGTPMKIGRSITPLVIA
jgi:hypothetical protein